MSLNPLLQHSPTFLVYGGASVGKTSSTIRAFNPASTFYVELEPGAFAPFFNRDVNPWRGPNGEVVFPRSDRFASLATSSAPFGDLETLVFKYIVPAKAHETPADPLRVVVLDGATTFCTRAVFLRTGGGKDGYSDNARFVTRKFLELIVQLSAAGMIVCVVAHESAPKTGMTGFIPGGPKIVEWNESAQLLVAGIDVVLRAGVHTPPGASTPHRAFFCDPLNPNYIGRTRDRFGTCAEVQPLDLRSVVLRTISCMHGRELPPPAEFPTAPQGSAVGV